MREIISVARFLSESGVPRALHFLIRPLAGVREMHLAQRGGQSVLLIGEVHQSNACRGKGFVPVTDIVVEFLKTTQTEVDFMVEVQKEMISGLKRSTERQLTQVQPILLLLNRMLAPYIATDREDTTSLRFPHARVHWLDALKPKPKKKPILHALDDFEDLHLGNSPSAETLIEKLGELALLRALNPTAPNPQMVKELVQLLKALGVPDPLVELVWRTNPGLDYKREVTWTKLREFVRAVAKLVLTTHRFEKCTTFHLEYYVSAFQASYGTRSDMGCEELLFDLQRFTMDMYACCRLLKTEGAWYKTVVIYAGATHVQALKAILGAAKFTVRSIEVPFNPMCC